MLNKVRVNLEICKFQTYTVIEIMLRIRDVNKTYGTQKIIKKGFPYLIPLLFPEKVDSLRKEMGLGSLWEELNDEYGGDWSLEKYQLKKDELKEVF